MQHSLDRDLAADPILIPHRGRLAWLFPSGKIVPDVSGGIDDPKEPDPDKKFTQADLDRLIDERLKRERSKAPELPADYKDLQAKATELDTLKAATATAEEKTTARIAALEDAVRQSNEATAAATAAGLEEKRRSAIVAAAATAKAANPHQVAALLKQDAVTIGDDGQVTGADEAVKEFLESNPHFVGKTGVPKPDAGQGKAGESKTFGDGGRAEAQKRFGGGNPVVAAGAGTPQK